MSNEKTLPEDRSNRDQGSAPCHQRGVAFGRVRSTDLFGSRQQLVIEHSGTEYVLLITRNGKLLLNVRR